MLTCLEKLSESRLQWVKAMSARSSNKAGSAGKGLLLEVVWSRASSTSVDGPDELPGGAKNDGGTIQHGVSLVSCAWFRYYRRAQSRWPEPADLHSRGCFHGVRVQAPRRSSQRGSVTPVLILTYTAAASRTLPAASSL